MPHNSERPTTVKPLREALRQKGQFWTPAWTSEAMVAYVIGEDGSHIFDPAVGEGAFFRAAKAIAAEANRNIELFGYEIDAQAIDRALKKVLCCEDMAQVQIKDFILHPPDRKFRAIVANPPYIRHHRLSREMKATLNQLGRSVFGKSLDGRTGLHVYFLLRALQLLEKDGRLAFIMPADTCEGIFSVTLWKWIAKNYRLDAVITFAPHASPFPGVDTNPIIFLIKNAEPKEEFIWAKCEVAETEYLKRWVQSKFKIASNDIKIYQRQIPEGLSTGLSREPNLECDSEYKLSDFACVMRGIATGANEFFFLTREKAEALEIPDEFLLPAIGRTRDVSSDTITIESIEYIARKGRPTLLFSPDGRCLELFPSSVQKYLESGERAEIHRKTLIATRRPWYKMEVRFVPPILFAYLGRRNARFIFNDADVVPLTGFLCVYPHQSDATFIKRLWRILNSPKTVANLTLVGKSYGAGAIKVEPRALERLSLPNDVVQESGILDCDLPMNKNAKSLQPNLFSIV